MEESAAGESCRMKLPYCRQTGNNPADQRFELDVEVREKRGYDQLRPVRASGTTNLPTTRLSGTTWALRVSNRICDLCGVFWE
jgi:hypothetical protein